MQTSYILNIPTNCLMMKNTIAQFSESIARSRNIFTLTELLGHVRKCFAKRLPQNHFVFTIKHCNPKSKSQFGYNLIRINRFSSIGNVPNGLRNISIKAFESRSIRENSIPIFPTGHLFHLLTDSIPESNLKHRQTDIQRLCQSQIFFVVQNSATFVCGVTLQVFAHSLSRKCQFQ